MILKYVELEGTAPLEIRWRLTDRMVLVLVGIYAGDTLSSRHVSLQAGDTLSSRHVSSSDVMRADGM